MRRSPRGSPAPVRAAPAGPAQASPLTGGAARGPGAAPLDLRLSYTAAQAILREGERPLRAWLDEHIDYVRALSARAAAAELMRRLPEARGQGAAYAEGVIRSWAAERGVTLRPLSIVPHPADAIPAARAAGPSLSDSRIVSAVSTALRIATEGVVIDRAHGRFQINASGATTQLRSGSVRVGGGVSWAGEMTLTTSVGGAHFSASMSAERWRVRLSFPGGSMPADLSRLTAIFNQAGAALPTVLREAAALEGLDDAPELVERLSAELDAIKRAVSAARTVAATPPGVSFGIEAGGPGLAGAGPGAGAAPQATSIQGVLTIRF